MTEAIMAQKADRIQTITLNRPDAMNAFRPEMLHTLNETIKSASKDDDLSVIILKGAGRCFSAGVDLKVLQGKTPIAGKVEGVFDDAAYEVAQSIRNSHLPVIAQVHGFCFTGALEIALHCDMIYTTADTKFGDTHAKFGLRPSWGMSQTLPHAVGMRRAKELSYTSRTFSGAEAKEWGMANEAVADVEALEKLVMTRATEIAGNSAGSIRAHKDLHNLATQNRSLEEAIAEESARDYPYITDTSERLGEF